MNPESDKNNPWYGAWAARARWMRFTAILLLGLLAAAPPIAAAGSGGRAGKVGAAKTAGTQDETLRPMPGERSRNWLPNGVKLGEDYGTGPHSPEFFYDMYFGCEPTREGNDTIVYPFRNCDIPDLRAGDILVHGDYEEGFHGYKVLGVRRDPKAQTLTVQVRNLSAGDLPSMRAKVDFATQKPLYTKETLADGTVVSRTTTDERFFNLRAKRDPLLRLDRGEEPMRPTAPQQKEGLVSEASATYTWPEAINKVLSDVDLQAVSGSVDAYTFGSEPYAATGSIGADYSVHLKNMSIGFTPTIDLGWTGGGTSSLTEAHASVGATFSYTTDLTASVTVAGNYTYTRTLGTYSHYFMVGYFVCSARFTLNGKATLNATGPNVSFTGGVTASFNQTVGASWTSSGGWVPILSSSFLPKLYNSANGGTGGMPTFTSTAACKFSAGFVLEPKCALYVLDFAGPAINLTVGPKFELNFTDPTHWDWGVYGCLKADVSFDLSIPVLGKPLVSWSHDLYSLNLSGMTCDQGCCLLYPRYNSSGGTDNANSKGSAGTGGEPGQDNSIASNNTDGTVFKNTNPPTLVDGTALIGRPSLTAPAEMTFSNATTNTLRPTFSWSAVSGATKYEIQISQMSFETTTTSYAPSSDLAPAVQAPWRVRAYKSGRYGPWSDVRRVNVGIEVNTGNSYYGKLDVGNRVDVLDPRINAIRTFWLYDIDSSTSPRQVRLRFTDNGNWVDLVLSDNVAKGPAEIGSDFGLFVYPLTVFDGAQGRFSELMIAPYFVPRLTITYPSNGSRLSGAEVRLDAEYLGKDVPWRGIGNPPKAVIDLKKICYNGGSCGSSETFNWVLSAPVGNKNLTVELTDLLGQKTTQAVTVYYDAGIPNYVFRGPLGDDYRCINRSFSTLSDGWTVVRQYIYRDTVYGPCSDWIGGAAQDNSREGLLAIMVDALGLATAANSVPSGATGIFVVDRNEYNNPSPINSTYGPITYKDLYQALAWKLGTDSLGRFRVWTSRNPWDAIPCMDLEAPKAPSFSSVTSSSITLTWQDLRGEAGYQVERCSGAGCTSWEKVGPQLGVDVTTYTDTTVAAGATYRYRVVAKGAAPCGDSVGAPAEQTARSADGIQNGDFEGVGGWTTSGAGSCPGRVDIGETAIAYQGSKCGSIILPTCSLSSANSGSLQQTFTVPANACRINYVVKGTGTGEPCGYPLFLVRINDTQIESFTTSSAVNGTCVFTDTPWRVNSFDISPYRNQTVTISFIAQNENASSRWSKYYIDAVWISVPPGTVPAPSFNGVTHNSVTLTWQDTFGEGGYQVQLSTDGGSTWNNRGSVLAANATTFTDTGLQPNTPYWYRIVSILRDGCGQNQTGAVAETRTLCANPGRPGAPTFSGVGANGVTVNWVDVANEDGYQVQRARYSAGACESFVNVGPALPPNTTSYSDQGNLLPLTSYCYRVVASPASGCTPQVGASSTVTTTCANPGAPAVPTFSDVKSTSITLNWTDVSNETGYQIERCSGSNCTSWAAATSVLPAGTTSFTDTGLQPNTIYRYRIVAKAAPGCTAQTGASSANVTTAPASPTGVAASGGCTSVRISWSASPGATSYDVYRGSACGTQTNTFANKTSPFTDTSAVAGRTYYYWVVAKNGSGSSPASSCVKIQTASTAPGKPTLSSPANSAWNVSRTPALSWGTVTGATSYRVEVSTSPTFSTITRSATRSSVNWTVSPALEANKIHYWRVAGINACGTGSWSTSFSFKTGP